MVPTSRHLAHVGHCSEAVAIGVGHEGDAQAYFLNWQAGEAGKVEGFINYRI